MFRMILWGNRRMAGKLDEECSLLGWQICLLLGIGRSHTETVFQHWHWQIVPWGTAIDGQGGLRPSHLSILCTCCLSFSPQTKVHPPGRDHPRCLLNTTTQNPLENRLVQIQALVYHFYNEHRSQRLHCRYPFLPDWSKDGVVQDYKLKTLGSSVRKVSESLLPGLAKSIDQQGRSEAWYGQQVRTGSVWLHLTFCGIPHTVLKRKYKQALGRVMCYYLHQSPSQFQSPTLMQSDTLGDQSGKEV